MNHKYPSVRTVRKKNKTVEPKSWRILGIMSEFVEATECLSDIAPAVSIFGSARMASDSEYYQLTCQIARKLSDAGFSIISGGGPGIMEAANLGAYQGKGLSVGLNIQLPTEQMNNSYQNVSQTFRHFFSRKYAFVKHANAYIVMPGGFGTLDELLEALTLIQTKKSRKIPVILVCSDFWSGLLDWLRNTLVREGMINDSDMDLISVIDDPDEIVKEIFEHYKHRGFEPRDDELDMMMRL